jgi:hypothetical protein
MSEEITATNPPDATNAEEITAKIRNIKPHLIYQLTDEKRIHLYLLKRFYEDIMTENIDEYYKAITNFTEPLYFNFKTAPLFSGDMNRHYISHCLASFRTDLTHDETPYFRTATKENMIDIWSDCLAGQFGRDASKDPNVFKQEGGIHKIVWQLDKTPRSLISVLKKIYNIDPTPQYAVEIIKLLFASYKEMYKSKIRQTLFSMECTEQPRILDTEKLYYIAIAPGITK